MEEKFCRIWREFEAKTSNYYDPYYIIDSPRMGGKYKYNPYAFVRPIEDEEFKARLTTLLINQRVLGIEIPEITRELIEQARRTNALPVHKRAHRLLQRITLKMEYINSTVPISKDTEIGLELMAWTETLSWAEVKYLIDYLEEKQWITTVNFALDSYTVQVTVEGHSQLVEPSTNINSTQCFVAMWFNEETDKCYQESIKPAIEQAGYEAIRIDEKEHINKIDDEIIAEIRRSLFIVADFTHGNDGVRGGVYFEAGFAYGLNIPVIFTCREDKINELHFDTRQYNHIVWKADKLEEFCQNLSNRILAIIGEGPNY